MYLTAVWTPFSFDADSVKILHRQVAVDGAMFRDWVVFEVKIDGEFHPEVWYLTGPI